MNIKIILGVLVLLFGSIANAEIIKLDFTGVITNNSDFVS